MGHPGDVRADICSLGLILLGCSPGAALDLDVSDLPASPELREVVRCCLAPDSDERIEAPDALTALAATPEAVRTVRATATRPASATVRT